ncbi:antitermination protein NusB [Protaetiibacter larvae]|uniref:Antitermination protein NusB n=1 Tax=Protaetiibacter larvae TaxID=2592654 RepID=A0A5C1Y9P7_9MICO|nr:antitermination protein NusB [Protaetiibacter larvae]QEO10526.1 antitermination protein NusB [Protaetiibacter larvae]
MTDYSALGASLGGVWFSIVFVNTALAAALDRSRLGYFLFSLFFAPIASLVLAIAGRKTA